MDFEESLLRQNECKFGMVAFERKIFVAVGLVVSRGLRSGSIYTPLKTKKKIMSYRAFALTFVFTTQLTHLSPHHGVLLSIYVTEHFRN